MLLTAITVCVTSNTSQFHHINTIISFSNSQKNRGTGGGHFSLLIASKQAAGATKSLAAIP